jgi:ribosomal-protein-alanine N-acetyltransferase
MNQAVFTQFPVLQTERLVLREIDPQQDLEPFYSYITDKRVNRFIAEDDIPRNIEDAALELGYWAGLFHKRHSIFWAISLKNNDKLIGTCGFNNWSRTHNRVEISYDLSHSHWGKGLMTEALTAICDYAFMIMQVNRIQASIAIDNVISQRVMEKLGFVKEGKMSEFGFLHGYKKDFYMYAKLAKDAL